MLLVDLVASTETVAATRSRREKVAALSEALGRLTPEEAVPAIGLLVGKPRQGRLGVGWRALETVQVAPAAEPTLTIADVDDAFTALAGTNGAGSTADRAASLRALLASVG